MSSSSSSSSILVNLADDADLRLISLLTANDPALHTKCTACVADANQLMNALCTSKSSAMKVITSLVEDPKKEEDAVGALSLLAGLLQRCTAKTTEQAKKGFVQTIMDAIVGSTSSKDNVETTEKKMALLSVLYNLLSSSSSSSNSALSCTILARVFQVAAAHSTLLTPDSTWGRLLVGDTPPLVALVKSWNSKDRCALYETICAIEDDAARKQRFLLLLLQEEQPPKDIARRVAIGTIADPVTWFRWQRSLLTVPSIQALKKQEPDLYNVLEIFQQGTVNEYQAFFKGKNEQKMLSAWGITAESCQKYMRILSLCSLAGEHDEIPYQEIQNTLHVQDDVESWVVAAVKSGLLEAKMDQLSQKVMVERCVVRQFDDVQWKKLQTRLVMWKKNVGSVLAALEQSQTATAVSTN